MGCNNIERDNKTQFVNCAVCGHVAYCSEACLAVDRLAHAEDCRSWALKAAIGVADQRPEQYPQNPGDDAAGLFVGQMREHLASKSR